MAPLSSSEYLTSHCHVLALINILLFSEPSMEISLLAGNTVSELKPCRLS